MARVLYVVPEGPNLGGIITSSENLLRGFIEAGHEPTFVFLRQRFTEDLRMDRVPTPAWRDANNWRPSEMPGFWYHPVYSWFGPQLTYKSTEIFQKIATKHDVVVWSSLFGINSKEFTKGYSGWVSMFRDHGKPNVVMIRDDHLQTRQAWAMALQPWVTAWAAVQRNSYDSCAGLGRRAIISSGHAPPADNPPASRPFSLFSCQTFKMWKHTHKFAAMAPYLIEQGASMTIAGDGLEYNYMTSKTKGHKRPSYYCTEDTDPDAPADRLGGRFWENALSAGMNYLGPIPEEVRDEQLLKSEFLVDLSFRNDGTQTGQTNRIVIEAMRHGCIPLAVPQFIAGTGGQNDYFAPGKNYLPIHPYWSPKKLADQIAIYHSMSGVAKQKIRDNNLDLARRFSRATAAQQLIDLAAGAAGDYYEDAPVDSRLVSRGLVEFEAIFGKIEDKTDAETAAR